MYRTLMKSKIHRATITEANLNYVGSITIDRALAEQADLLENEKVQVVNLNNGSRLETYVIYGPPGSGCIELNGAAARLGHKGDLVIIISYGVYNEEEVRQHEPIVVLVDEHNQPVRTLVERHGQTVE
jgi:aspartate 1-decarboxylase